MSTVRPTIPNVKEAANQGPDRVGIPLVVDLIFGASTGCYILIISFIYKLVMSMFYDSDDEWISSCI